MCACVSVCVRVHVDSPGLRVETICPLLYKHLRYCKKQHITLTHQPCTKGTQEQACPSAFSQQPGLHIQHGHVPSMLLAIKHSTLIGKKSHNSISPTSSVWEEFCKLQISGNRGQDSIFKLYNVIKM